MNTKIYLWIEPMVMDHKRCSEKVYFNAIFEGDHYSQDKEVLDDFLEGERMADIMAFASIDSNWNFSAISAVLTNEEPMIEFADSPKEKKIKLEVAKVVNSNEEILLKEKDLTIEDDGQITLKVEKLGVAQKIDFPKLWSAIERNIIGKIQEGDKIELTDDDGNLILEINGGSFLNVGGMGVPLQVKTKERGVIGGLYIRNDGSIDIGDYERTVYIKIYTNKLLKASLKLNKSLSDISLEKILPNSHNSH